MKQRFFNLARDVSKQSKHRFKIGAVIVNHGKPISKKSNKIVSHPKYTSEEEFRYNLHAEINAIINSPKSKLKGAEIYVYREYKNGKPALAKPCKHCMAAIIESGIKRIYFSIPEYPYFKEIKL